MQKIETPKGNEKNLRQYTSKEKMVFKRKFKKGKLILFSESTFIFKREINLLTIKMGKKRKKL